MLWYLLHNMTQQFKSLYFATSRTDSVPKRMKVAFGHRDQDLYKFLKFRSSEEIRQLLGMAEYSELQQFADDRYLSLNKACIVLLRQALKDDFGQAQEVSHFPDPLMATYRGGNGDLLHHWYPLLEGFAPRFVKKVIEQFAPGASVILDPFGGAGTAPLTAAFMGRMGLYCELNPVFQYVTAVKSSALRLKYADRMKLAGMLKDHALALKFMLDRFSPDAGLVETYDAAFRGSRFFDDETFRHVLQLRSYADEIDKTWPLLSQAIVVATLAALVPASLMKRAGDLRFKNEKELQRKEFPITDGISARLHQMAIDLERAEDLLGDALLVSENVRSLHKLPPLGADAVITSPPYLNGTNYVRNVKLELWFLRALKKADDLARLRFQAITGGINDVTTSKCVVDHPKEVLELVHSLASVAYDSRIPLMVGSYFADMLHVFKVMTSHLKPGATVAIDIGDSRYSGIHVATDKLLEEISAPLGYSHVASHPLRARRSRDGELLTQKLLVFEYKGSRLSRTATPKSRRGNWSDKWVTFKHDLPHQAHPYRMRNWGHPLHSLCSYEGKMKPALAHFLVDTFVPLGGTILDPFAGVGTIPFEACLQGKRGIGIELSPAAYSIARAKLKRPDALKVGQVVADLSECVIDSFPYVSEVESTKRINFNKSLDQYYHPDTLLEILAARRFFQRPQNSTVEHNLVFACLLHILHGNRPYALSRRSHSITPFAPTGPIEYRSLVQKLNEKVARSLSVEYPPATVEGDVFFQDATLWWPDQLNDLDAVITSPPFFDSTRFYLSNWIRLWFSGWEREDFSSRPLHFIDVRQKQSLKVYEDVFRQARERLKPSGVFVLHLGKSSKADMAVLLQSVAKRWFRVCDVMEENVTHTESHGMRDKGRVTGHQLMVLSQ